MRKAGASVVGFVVGAALAFAVVHGPATPNNTKVETSAVSSPSPISVAAPEEKLRAELRSTRAALQSVCRTLSAGFKDGGVSYDRCLSGVYGE